MMSPKFAHAPVTRWIDSDNESISHYKHSLRDPMRVERESEFRDRPLKSEQREKSPVAGIFRNKEKARLLFLSDNEGEFDAESISEVAVGRRIVHVPIEAVKSIQGSAAPAERIRRMQEQRERLEAEKLNWKAAYNAQGKDPLHSRFKDLPSHEELKLAPVCLGDDLFASVIDDLGECNSNIVHDNMSNWLAQQNSDGFVKTLSRTGPLKHKQTLAARKYAATRARETDDVSAALRSVLREISQSLPSHSDYCKALKRHGATRRQNAPANRVDVENKAAEVKDKSCSVLSATSTHSMAYRSMLQHALRRGESDGAERSLLGNVAAAFMVAFSKARALNERDQALWNTRNTTLSTRARKAEHLVLQSSTIRLMDPALQNQLFSLSPTERVMLSNVASFMQVQTVHSLPAPERHARMLSNAALNELPRAVVDSMNQTASHTLALTDRLHEQVTGTFEPISRQGKRHTRRRKVNDSSLTARPFMPDSRVFAEDRREETGRDRAVLKMAMNAAAEIHERRKMARKAYRRQMKEMSAQHLDASKGLLEFSSAAIAEVAGGSVASAASRLNRLATSAMDATTLIFEAVSGGHTQLPTISGPISAAKRLISYMGF